MKTRKQLKTLSFIFLVFIFGCTLDTYDETTGLCPEVVSTNPENLSTEVPLNQNITVTFNEIMNPSSFTNASFVIMGDTQLSGLISFSGTTVTFTPSTPLVSYTTYTGIIKTSVLDVNGNALQTNYIWTFTTSLVIIPTVIFADPAPGELNIVLNKSIKTQFNMDMDESSVNSSTFQLKQGENLVDGHVSYNNVDATFNPSQALLPNTEYAITIKAGMKNTLGTYMDKDTTWSFSTGTAMAPAVKCNDPANQAVEVVLNKTISACFSQNMNPSTFNQTTFTLSNGSTPISGTITYIDSFVTFTPSINLISGTTYTAVLTTGVLSMDGISLLTDFI